MGLEDLRRSVSPNAAPADRDRIREQAADRCASAAHSSADLDTQVVSALWCATAHALRGHLHDAAHWSGNARAWVCAAFDEAIAAKPPELPPHRQGLGDWIGNLLFDDFNSDLPPSEVHHRGEWLRGRFPRVEQLSDLKSVAAAYDAVLRGQPAPPEVRVLPLPAGASSMYWGDQHQFGELALFDVLEEGSVFEVDSSVRPGSEEEPKKQPASVSVTSAFLRSRGDETDLFDSRTSDLFVGFTVHRAADVEASKVGATSAERGLSWDRWTPLYKAGYTTFSEPSVTLRFEVRDWNGTEEDPQGVAVVAQARTRRVWVPVGPAARVGEDHPLPEDLLNPWSGL